MPNSNRNAYEDAIRLVENEPLPEGSVPFLVRLKLVFCPAKSIQNLLTAMKRNLIVALRETMSKKVVRWTTLAPTEPGWYAAIETEIGVIHGEQPKMIEVRQAASGLQARYGNAIFPMTFFKYFCGPYIFEKLPIHVQAQVTKVHSRRRAGDYKPGDDVLLEGVPYSVVLVDESGLTVRDVVSLSTQVLVPWSDVPNRIRKI